MTESYPADNGAGRDEAAVESGGLEASPADLAEQRQDVRADDEVAHGEPVLDGEPAREAEPADVAEQRTPVDELTDPDEDRR